MSTLSINRRRNNDSQEPKSLPGNSFNIKEGNTRIGIRAVLADDPLTISFSSEVTIDVQPEVVVFDFGSFDLDTGQEAAAATLIQQYRDKIEFTDFENFNIESKNLINDALEQQGDIFDENNIDELILPDFCALREQAMAFYNDNGWGSFSVGEKRILIADWLVPTLEERQEIFQGAGKRREIFKLFASKISSILALEAIRSIEESAFNRDGEDFTNDLNVVLSPLKARDNVFESRSNINSNDANSQVVFIPFFSNPRIQKSFVIVISATEIEIDETADYRISYHCTVQAGNNTNFSVSGQRNRDETITPLNVQGMEVDGRGRSTVSHIPNTFRIRKGDKIRFVLANENGGNGAIRALSGKSHILIEKL